MNKKLNKRGTWNDLKKILLALIFGFVVIFFTIYISGGLGDSGDKSACKSWVSMRDSAKIGGIELGVLKSPCITSEDTIEKSDVEDENNEKIYEKLARDMYDCWDMYGKGEKDFFSDFDWGQSDTHCMICGEIKIDEKIKDKIIIDIDEFEEYLSQNNPPNHGESYAEFLVNAENSKIDFGDGLNLELEHGTPIYTMFVVNKRSGHYGEGFLGISGWVKGLGSAVLKSGISLVVGEASIPGVSYGTGAMLRKGVKIPYASGYKTTQVLVEETGQYTNVVTKGSKVVKGSYVALGVFVVGTTLFYLSDGSQLFPSLMLVNGKDIADKCDPPLYYNPKKELFEGFGGGSSGGAGAGGQTQ